MRLWNLGWGASIGALGAGFTWADDPVAWSVESGCVTESAAVVGACSVEGLCSACARRWPFGSRARGPALTLRVLWPAILLRTRRIGVRNRIGGGRGGTQCRRLLHRLREEPALWFVSERAGAYATGSVAADSVTHPSNRHETAVPPAGRFVLVQYAARPNDVF